MNNCAGKKVYVFAKTGKRTKVKSPTVPCVIDAEVWQSAFKSRLYFALYVP